MYHVTPAFSVQVDIFAFQFSLAVEIMGLLRSAVRIQHRRGASPLLCTRDRLHMLAPDMDVDLVLECRVWVVHAQGALLHP